MTSRQRSCALLTVVAVILAAGLACAQGDKPWTKAGGQAGEEITGPDGAAYVWVPPGQFMMGAEDISYREKPVHQVQTTRGFWLRKTPVTNAQYRSFCTATGREFPSLSDRGDDHPVVWLTWEDAKAYCDHYGLRLPTEAEWEYAAAGPDARAYPWGVEWDDTKCCNWKTKDPKGGPVPVGGFPEGVAWCGALDMAGNVWQWCADWYADDYYANSPPADPGGPADGQRRVIRGGCWGLSVPKYFRCAYRNYSSGPGYRFDDLGFRCVRGF